MIIQIDFFNVYFLTKFCVKIKANFSSTKSNSSLISAELKTYFYERAPRMIFGKFEVYAFLGYYKPHIVFNRTVNLFRTKDLIRSHTLISD